MTEGQDWNSRQLGEYIRAQRQLADLSLRRLADMTEVSNAYLSQIERGMHQPSIRVLRSIAVALNVSADTLLAQAGLLDTTADPSQTTPATDTETAIRNDPTLTPDDRDALIRVYRSLRKEPPAAE
jgi:transcriptional regulator with XRE-family HTH domain